MSAFCNYRNTVVTRLPVRRVKLRTDKIEEYIAQLAAKEYPPGVAEQDRAHQTNRENIRIDIFLQIQNRRSARRFYDLYTSAAFAVIVARRHHLRPGFYYTGPAGIRKAAGYGPRLCSLA